MSDTAPDPIPPEDVTPSQHSSPTEETKRSVKDRKNELWERLDDLLAGPRPARLISGVLIVVVALLVCASQVSDLWERIKINRHNASEYSNSAGVHDPSKDDPRGAVQAGPQTKQVEHLSHHLALHDGKAVPLPIDIASAVPSDVTVGIEYYTSDGCIFVHRHRGKTESDEWLPDTTQSSTNDNTVAPISPSTTLRLMGALRPRLVSANPEPAYVEDHLLRVQRMGRCLASHPPPFNWWWGPPNGCWVPMIRQFPDGCRHHQMFNSCGNYWDATITWDWCVH